METDNNFPTDNNCCRSSRSSSSANKKSNLKKLSSVKVNVQSSSCSEKTKFDEAKEIFKSPATFFTAFCLLYVPESWYIFIRLHHLLSERLSKLKSRAEATKVCEKFGVENNFVFSSDFLKSRLIPMQMNGNSPYSVLIKQIENLLNGEIENSQFEYVLRSLFPSEFYLMFTVDKIIQNCAKQLTLIVNDEISEKSLNLFQRWRMKEEVLNMKEINLKNVQYEKDARNLFGGQSCFKMFLHNDGKVSFELLPMKEVKKENEKEFLLSRQFSDFVNSYVKKTEVSSNSPINSLIPSKPIFLTRNVKRFVEQRKKLGQELNNETFDAANDTNLIIKEDLKAILTRKRSRSIYYVAGSMDYLYRKGSLSKNSMKSKTLKITELKNRKFFAWHEKWMLENVSVSEARFTSNWFVSVSLKGPCLKTVKRTVEMCPRRPPFNIITRYLSNYGQKPYPLIVNT